MESALDEFNESLTILEKYSGNFMLNLDQVVEYLQRVVFAKHYFKYLGRYNQKKFISIFKKYSKARQEGKIWYYKIQYRTLLGFEKEFVDFGEWHSEIIFNEEIKNREKELESRLNVVANQIKEVGKQEEKSRKMLSIFEQMNPEFPVNIDRIAELVKVEKTVAEEILIYTLNKYSKIGKYDPMSQMFVFSGDYSKKQQKKEKIIKCPECKTDIGTTESKCPKCGKEFETCSICRGIIVKGKTLKCSSCGRLFHKEHLEEWMNTNRNCPVCKNKL